MKLSIVMPSYNEEGSIEEAIKRADRAVEKMGLDYSLSWWTMEAWMILGGKPLATLIITVM